MIGRKGKFWGGSEKRSELELMWRQAADCSSCCFQQIHQIADARSPDFEAVAPQASLNKAQFHWQYTARRQTTD